jgi:nucleoid DNA-binding protein
VSFNRNLTHNDGLLIGSVSSEKGVNYGEARDLVEKFASDMKRSLTNGGEIDFENIGVFRVNREGSIQFEPDKNANYNLGSYGMESFRYEPVAGYDVRKRVIRARHEAYPQGINVRKLLVRAAVAVPVLLALIAVPLKTDLLGTRLEKSSLNPLATAEIENNKAAIDALPIITESVKQVAVEDVNLVAAEDVKQVVEELVIPATSVQTAPDAVPDFFLIAGSFKSADNATVMAGELRALGYEPILMDGPNGYTRVAAKGFFGLEAANSEKEKLSATVDGLWVLKK